MGKEKYNKEELIRLLIHEGKSYKEVAAMRGDGSTGEAIRKAANRYGIKVSDRKKLRKCEYCGKEHDGSFGSGRFCCSDCAKKYSLSFSKGKKPEEDFYWGGLTRMKLKLFANITNVTSLTPLKNIITTTTRKATGLSNSKIATQAKNAALDLHSVTKDAQNSFISPNGYVTKSYFTKRRPKGKKVEFVGDLFGNPNQLQKPKVINSSSSNKGGNSSISSLDAKRMNLKRYNSHKTRSLEVTPTAPGQNEWVKRVKTNGQARWENNGLYIPGFEKL